MISYSITGSSRFRCVAVLALVSAAASSGTGFLLSTLNISAFLTAPSSFAIFGVLLFAYDRFLWKVPVLKFLSFVPNFDGHWEGEIRQEDKTSPLHVEVFITQTWSKIAIEFRSELTVSNGQSFHINFENPKAISVKWIYNVQPVNLAQVENHGYGITILRCSHHKKIETMDGSYFSTKMRGGEINLKKI